MKFTDIYKIHLNTLTNHIVVDLIIVIIITTISIFLLKCLALHHQKKVLRNEDYFSQLMNYEIIIFSILFIVHALFSFLSILSFTLDNSISSIKLLALAFSYGLYLTFMMRRVDSYLKHKIESLELILVYRLLRLFLHFSIVPLSIATIIFIIN